MLTCDMACVRSHAQKNKLLLPCSDFPGITLISMQWTASGWTHTKQAPASLKENSNSLTLDSFYLVSHKFSTWEKKKQHLLYVWVFCTCCFVREAHSVGTTGWYELFANGPRERVGDNETTRPGTDEIPKSVTKNGAYQPIWGAHGGHISQQHTYTRCKTVNKIWR